ncbi:MAG: M20/M25/M40 family metallo-hydrolase [Anaerolineales bacterium]|nr:M20/M25/M40 family metallo-hydrolase [Anaerolineales bacterium]
MNSTLAQTHIARLLRHAPVQAAMAGFEHELAAAVDLIIAIQQVPAPTFAEAERAAFVEARMRALGLADVAQDGLHNVYGRIPGRIPAARPVIVSAHTDTVFDAGVDLQVRRETHRVHGPGIGDNSAGVAGLLLLAQALRRHGLQPRADVWLVANVGEEGMGDLRGMRAVTERFGERATYVVVEGGLFGQVCHQGIAVRRFRIDVTGPGGHSWGSFGTPSAIHVLGRLIAGIDGLSVPDAPRTTYNVGVIEGGTTINSIARTASLWLDLRSEAGAALAELETAVRQIIAGLAQRFPDVRIETVLVGDRPAGQVARSEPVVAWAEAALRAVGFTDVSYIAGSTDTNIPLSRGIPAVCIGLARSGNAHRPDEYLDTRQLPQGLSQLLLLVLAAAGLETPIPQELETER